MNSKAIFRFWLAVEARSALWKLNGRRGGVVNVTLTYDPRSMGASNIGYDANNRMTSETFTDGQSHGYAYDKVGNRLAMSDSTGITTHAYTYRNELQSVKVPLNKTMTHTYDPAGRRTGMQDYDGGAFVYGYDAASNQTHITNPLSQTTTHLYDFLNRVYQRQHANGAITNQYFDEAGNLTEINNVGPEGVPVSTLIYTFDCTNRKQTLQQMDGVFGPRGSSSSSSSSSSSGSSSSSSGIPTNVTITNWTYDLAYRLGSELRTSGNELSWSTMSVPDWANLTVDEWSTLLVSPTSFNITYDYDKAGNRKTMSDGSTITTYTYSPANRLTMANAGGAITTYVNDLAGNRTQVQDPVAGITYYTWDAVGRMASAEPPAGIVTMVYNADRQRMSKFSYDGGTTIFLVSATSLLPKAS
jgi:YD repeat-containing protein